VEAPLSDRVEPAPGRGLEPGRVIPAERHPSGADHLEAAAKARVSSEELEALRDRVRAELDDYELLESLGRGGMGAVFRARQMKLDREVAIKVLLPPSGEVEGWSERFQREAQALARLVHPGIVTVHDFGQGEDLAWIVMELVDGADLRQMLEEGRLPEAEALAIVPALCEALQYAHDQGVVHRDIKPENVLFDRFGRVKLVDFGLAKLSGDAGSPQLTRTDQAMGTPRYMAPEQLERPREVDHRADLFSLGVVFYEMLTGHVPAGVVEPPSQVAGVDAGIDGVVLSTLEREPDRRPQSAADIERQLMGFNDGEGTGAAQ
ncbi:MAG: serine/threonine-protein kinase, partial [Planctomycetota bacterium]